MRRLAAFVALACAGAVACLVPGPLAGAETPAAATLGEPVPGYARMGDPPAGANDWSCRPSAAHPRPVVLVHGTASSMRQAFSVLSPQLAAEGYCVFALNYGGLPTWHDPDRTVWGVSDITQSARELSRFVDGVLEHTEAHQVDIVAHSQGGLMTRQYLKYEGGADPSDPARNKVRSLIGLGPTNHGTTFNGQQQLYVLAAQLGLTNNALISNDQLSAFIFGIAGRQQLVGSKLIRTLNAGGETQPGVQYTVIASRDDQVVTPPEGSFLTPTSADVRNVWVQDGCPSNEASHGGLMTDPRSLYLVQVALDPAYSDSHPAPC